MWVIYSQWILGVRGAFMKYVSDKYAGSPDALIEVPAGGGFADMVKLRGDKEIGDRINKIIGRLAEANDLKGVIDQADFNDESKLGAGKEMQDRLVKLVAIFDGLDFRAKIPPTLIVARWFAAQQSAIEKLQGAQETAARELEEFVEEHSSSGGGEDGLLADAANDGAGSPALP